MPMKATVLLRSESSLDKLRRDATNLTRSLEELVHLGTYSGVTDAWARLMEDEGGIDVSLIFRDNISLRDAERVANSLINRACDKIGIILAAQVDTVEQADEALQNWGTELVPA